MTTIQTEIERITNEKDAQIARLQAALDRQHQAEQAAQQEIERINGLAEKKRRRQYAVDWFNTQARQRHEQAFAQLGDKLVNWQDRFNQAVETLKGIGQEFGELEREYEEAMVSLFSDALICHETDESLGVGWLDSQYHEEIRSISRPAKIADMPLRSMDQAALKFADVKSGLNRQPNPVHQWIRLSQSEANIARLRKIMDGAKE